MLSPAVVFASHLEDNPIVKDQNILLNVEVGLASVRVSGGFAKTSGAVCLSLPSVSFIFKNK